MIVYGDPSFEARLPALIARLRERLSAAVLATGEGRGALDRLRGLLIAAGELEQAAEDAGVDGPVRAALLAATDAAAAAFLGALAAGTSDAIEAADARGELSRTLRGALDRLEALPGAAEVTLRVKVPEGFAFYALYPEQYCEAAERWLAQQPAEAATSRAAVVVGVRSIGTGLSAVVATVLRRGGWACRRITVRPTGDPFDRRVRLPAIEVAADAHGLVVDEGPGLSGSSMAAAAEALAGVGVAPGRISFLPGHGGEPGAAATDAARAWWRSSPRHVARLDELRWDGRSLEQLLADRTTQLCGGAVHRVAAVGGGAWRQHLYASRDEWPAAFAPFERTKFRCVLARAGGGGAGGAVLWKFEGLADATDGTSGMADAAFTRAAKLAAGGWTAAPLGAALGFVATPWIDGRPLQRGDASADVLRHLGEYAVAASPGVLTDGEQRAGWDRLAEMLYWNTRESLGEDPADRARRRAESARALLPAGPAPAYGDGRLAPHEWLRTPDGRILKTDCAGHDVDHTAVGRQSIAWDAAGAIVEWALDEVGQAALLHAVRHAGGLSFPPALLEFHRAAYAAFRVGLCSMCLAQTSDPAERDRLERAEAFYRDALSRLLGSA